MPVPPWFQEHCDRLLQGDRDLTNLNLNIRRLSLEMVEHLCQALSQNSVLKVLNLTSALTASTRGGDGDSSDVLKLVADMLAVHPSLQSIHLSYNQLDAVQSLGPSLATNKSLLQLHLNFNNIHVESAVALAHGLAQNDTLESLQLGYNLIGNQGCRALAQALVLNRSLKTLGLVRNFIDTTGAQALLQVLEGDPNKSNTTLERVLLDLNHHIPSTFLSQVDLLCRANRAGRRYLVPKTHHDDDNNRRTLPLGAWPRLLAKSANDPAVLYYFLSHKHDLLLHHGKKDLEVKQQSSLVS